MDHSADAEPVVDLSFVARRDLPDLFKELQHDGHDAGDLDANAGDALRELRKILDDLDDLSGSGRP